jgi:8-oxo-dGTP pyrophosphatase MutT (NUDIX family)
MIKQYGAIPFTRDDGTIRVVLVTSAGGCWIFPKGNFEEEFGKCGTAELESFEEAGVKGKVLPHPVYRAKIMIRGGIKARLMLYPLEVQQVFDQWPEDDRRQRRIVTLNEADQLIDSRGLKRCLGGFARDFLPEK